MATCELTVTNRSFGLPVKLTPSQIASRGAGGSEPRRLPDLPNSVLRLLREASPGPPGGPGPFSGGHSEEATPVPIPNTEVKLLSPDGTALVTAWESRTLPDFIRGAARRKPGRPFLFSGGADRHGPGRASGVVQFNDYGC